MEVRNFQTCTIELSFMKGVMVMGKAEQQERGRLWVNKRNRGTVPLVRAEVDWSIWQRNQGRGRVLCFTGETYAKINFRIDPG